MKELSIEEKAKRYDKALEAIKSLQEVNPSDEGIQNWVNENFPELKESEDDRILKHLKAVVKAYDMWAERGLDMNDILAWLEKKGEQKQTVIIPRFRVGDVITSTKNSALKYKIKAVGVLNELGEYDYVVEDVTDTDYKGRIHEMSISKVDEWGVVVEQKSAWSEEDESILDEAIYFIRREPYRECDAEPIVEWLKSLKDRVQPQSKQEWSEEDKNMLEDTIYMVTMQRDENRSDNEYQRAEKCIDWLNSFRPQNTWKPSDKQMNTLEHYMHTLVCNEHKEILFGLYADLKKLREE